MVAIWSFSSAGLAAAASVEDVSVESVTIRSSITVQLFAEPAPETSIGNSQTACSPVRTDPRSNTKRSFSKCN